MGCDTKSDARVNWYHPGMTWLEFRRQIEPWMIRHRPREFRNDLECQPTRWKQPRKVKVDE